MDTETQTLKQGYARCLKQLEIEAKTQAIHRRNSKMYKSSIKTVSQIGQELCEISLAWYKAHKDEPIIPELNF